MPDDPLRPVLARQPIFDRHLRLVAHELLFRGGQCEGPPAAAGDAATWQVLAEIRSGTYSFTPSTLPLFVNFTRHYLINPHALPAPHIVVEVLEDVRVDDQLLEGLRTLKQAGHRIALDDFCLKPSNRVLLPLADIVKVDLLAMTGRALSRQLAELRRWPITLLAEKIERREQFEHCQQLGFELYQGYYLARPQSARQLKFSSRFPALLGQLRATLAELADGGSACPMTECLLHTACAPPALSRRTLARGAICRQLAAAPLSELAFATGVLSMFDVLTGAPLVEVAGALSLPAPIGAALLEAVGPLAGPLSRTLAAELAHSASDNELLALKRRADSWAASVYPLRAPLTLPALHDL